MISLAHLKERVSRTTHVASLALHGRPQILVKEEKREVIAEWYTAQTTGGMGLIPQFYGLGISTQTKELFARDSGDRGYSDTAGFRRNG